MAQTDTVFAGSIPAFYDRYLGPLLFEPYAADLVRRLADISSGRVLETAAGTGIVTCTLVRAARGCCNRRDRPQATHAGFRSSAAGHGARRMASSRCACPSVRKRFLRRGSLPVRCDVLSRKAGRVSRGPKSAEAGWPLYLQRVGSP